LGCGYEIAFALENRCPECGLPFDPKDAGTFAVWQSDLANQGYEPVYGALIGAMVAAVASGFWGGLSFMAGIGAIGAAVGFVAGFAFRRDRD